MRARFLVLLVFLGSAASSPANAEDSAFGVAMDELSKAFRAKQFEDALGKARALRKALLAQKVTDPGELGWARFYEFKSLYELKRDREALALLDSKESRPFLLTTKNAAFTASVAAEVAYRLKLPDEVVRWSKQCMDHRREASDPQGVDQCAANACVMLGRLDQASLAARFCKP